MKSIKRIFAIVLVMAMMFSPVAINSSADNIASGTIGGCNWVIDADGTLTIEPGAATGDCAAGQLPDDIDDPDEWPWNSATYYPNINEVKITSNIKAGNSLAYMFTSCENIESVDLSGLDTSAVTSMRGMFYGCHNLKSVDLTGFDTSAVTKMSHMFRGCSDKLETLDLSSFDTSAVNDMMSMFDGCDELTTIYVGDKWSTDNVDAIDSEYMFYDCTALVGDAGTQCNGTDNIDKAYAHIDGGTENPGYFTEKLYDVYVAGTRITSLNKDDVLGAADEGSTVKYVPSTNTLILDKADINASGSSIIELGNTGKDFTIEVIGDCTLKGDQSGIVVGTDKLIINGGGTLNITLASSANDTYSAIYTGSDVEISDITLNIDTSATTNGIGILANNLVIDNCKGKINTKITTIYCYSNVEIKDSNITSIKSVNDAAICASGSIKIAKSTIDSIVAELSVLTANKTINFEGKVVLDALSSNYFSIFAGEKIDFSSLTSGSKIHAKGGGVSLPFAIFSQTNSIDLGKNCVVTTPEGGEVVTDTTQGAPLYGIGKDGVLAAEATVEVPYTVTFDSNDGSSVDAQKVYVGNKATKPSDPTKSGYTFDGWYTDEDCTKAYDFATKVTSDMTLYAKWIGEYVIKESVSDATWTKGGSAGLKITSTADFSKFVSVSVDGKVIDAKNYDKTSGSTIITFKPAYLETLSVGKHTVVITSTDGSATGVLTIEEEKIADTADNSAIGAFVALGAFAAAGYVSLKKRED